MADLQGGILIGFYFNKNNDGNMGEQLLLAHASTADMYIENGLRKWKLDASVAHPEDPNINFSISCIMTYVADRPIPRNDQLVGSCIR